MRNEVESMSKGYSGLFHGTLGTSYSNGSQPVESYKDRGIEVPKNIQTWMSKLKQSGSFITGTSDDFSMKDVSVLSKETGVEYAKVTIGNKSYLIRGDNKGTTIPPSILKLMIKNNGIFEYHSHPYNDDLAPSPSDLKMMKKIYKSTKQKTSTIVTPNGRTVLYNRNGTVSTGTVENKINDELKNVYLSLFGGNTNA